MANRSAVVEVLIRARDTTSRVLGEFRRRWQAGVRVVKEMATAFLATTAAATAFVFGLTKLVQQGDKVAGVQAAFARTTDDAAAALERLREASGGTISDFDLMARHNQMLALGTARSTEEFARMLETSRALAESLGVDDVEAMNKLANVMASGSKRAARELGLEIEAGATRNEILTEAEEVVSRIAGATSDASDAGDRFAATITNVKDRLAVFVAESPIAATFLDGLGGIMEDAVSTMMGDVDTLIEGMKALGRMMFDAWAVGVNESIEAFVDKGNPFGRAVAGWFGGNADAARANFEANREALAAIARSANAQAEARRKKQGGGGAGGGGAPPLEGELWDASAFRDMSAFGLSAEGLATYRARQDALRRARFGLGVDVPGTTSRFMGRLLGTGAEGDPAQLPGIGVPVRGTKDAALELEDATGVAVDSLGRMADAAVNESQRMESAVIQSFANIIANIKTKNGLFGSTLLGGFVGVGLGLVGSLLGRRGGGDQEIPVRVKEYDRRALSQLKEIEGPIFVEPVFMLPDGSVLTLEQIERSQRDRQNRDERVRPSPRTGRPISGR